jgi:hypothetical protein
MHLPNVGGVYQPLVLLPNFVDFAKLWDSGKGAALDLKSQFVFHCHFLSIFNNQYCLKLIDLF